MKKKLISLLLLPLVVLSQAGDWEMDFDEDFAAASARRAGNWWDGLGMSSVWPLTADANDVVGGINGTWAGTETYSATNGITGAYLNGSSVISFGDVYDVGAGANLSFGGWFYMPLNVQGADAVVIGKGEPFTGTHGSYYVAAVDTSGSSLVAKLVTPVGQSAALMSSVNNGENWFFISVTIERSQTHTKAVSSFNNTFFFEAASHGTTVSMDNDKLFVIGRSQGYTRYIRGWARDCFVKVGGTTNDMATIYNATKSAYGY